MGTPTMPTLNLAQRSAVALVEAADELSAASSTAAFLAALDTNHRVWTVLERIARLREWTAPDRRQTQFALKTSTYRTRPVSDADVEALIRVDREVSLALAGGPVETLQARARSMWRQASRSWLDARPMARQDRAPDLRVIDPLLTCPYSFG